MSKLSAAILPETKKQNQMSKMSAVLVLAAALVAVSVLAAALYIGVAMKSASPPQPAAKVAPQVSVAIAKTVAPATSNSVYVSESQLKRYIDEAAEHPWDARGRALLLALNKRYEYRCCGLPR